MTMEAAGKWTILSQQETTGQDATGHYVSGVRVTFSLANGTVGSVFVPDASYNADTAKALIQARVNALLSVHGLSGE